MSERSLIGAMIASRDAWGIVQPHLEDGDLTDQGRIIVEHVGSYYDRDTDATQCDPELLARAVGRALSNPKHKETFNDLILGIAAEGHSSANVVNDYVAVKREVAGHRLATLLAAGRTPDVVVPALEVYQQWLDTDSLGEEGREEVEVGIGAAELVAKTTGDQLIEVWPLSLNRCLAGGMVRGQQLVVFARPEMGKTMFVINAIAGFLSQGLKVLYVGNEEPTHMTRKRVMGRLTGLVREEIDAEPDLADELCEPTGYFENFGTMDLTPGTPRQLERLCLAWTPDVLIIDQLRNLNVGEEHFVQKLEKAATAARNLGKKHDMLIVSVTQAGDSASGKAILDMGDIDSSNTGIPAQADVLVGIGASNEDLTLGRRVLSLCKNKRAGTHDHVPVNVDLTTSNIGG